MVARVPVRVPPSRVGTRGPDALKLAASLASGSPMLLESPATFSMHRVASAEDWRRVRALRFDALRIRGEIGESQERAYGDAHDAGAASDTFLLMRNGRAVASTRATAATPARRGLLPAMDVFASEVDRAVGLECTIVEASLTVTDPAASGDARIALFHLFKAHMLRCAAERADWLLAAVRESEIGFYRRMFDMEILSGAEACPGIAAPRVLMGLAWREHFAQLAKRIPVLAVTLADEAAYAASGEIRFPAPPLLRERAA